MVLSQNFSFSDPKFSFSFESQDLKPRSRMKLFRSPGSLSYRRMLPFLMNIAKDNSGNSFSFFFG